MRNARMHGLAAVLGACIALPVPAAPVPGAGSLVITEVMADPTVVLDEVGEWFELLNPGDVSLSLDGMTVQSKRGEGTEAFVVSCPACEIAPGGLLVFGRTGDLGVGWSGTAYAWGNAITLANSKDDILLLNADGQTIVEAGWTSTAAGKSRVLQADGTWANERVHTYAGGDFGTPGSDPRFRPALVGLLPEPSTPGASASVPEPSTWSLLAAGLLLAGVSRRSPRAA